MYNFIFNVKLIEKISDHKTIKLVILALAELLRIEFKQYFYLSKKLSQFRTCC